MWGKRNRLNTAPVLKTLKIIPLERLNDKRNENWLCFISNLGTNSSSNLPLLHRSQGLKPLTFVKHSDEKSSVKMSSLGSLGCPD